MSRVNKYPTVRALLRAKSKRDPATGCWNWTGTRTSAGYGIANSALLGLRQVSAHRLSYEVFKGVIPKGKLVRHKCDNPACIRPSHLQLGTNQDNANDKVERGRSNTGEKNPCSKLTADKVLEIYRDGQTAQKIADCYGVSVQTVKYIRQGRLWSSVTGHPKPIAAE